MKYDNKFPDVAIITSFLLFIFCVVHPLLVRGEEGGGDQLSRKIENPAFSITKIEPDSPQERVSLHFSDAVELLPLKQYLKLMPPIPLQWYNSYLTNGNTVLVLSGRFKRGQKYSVFIPAGLKSANGKEYQRAVSEFIMPDFPARVSFLEEGSVIELKGRQMLHLDLMNIDEVLFMGLRIPPFMIQPALEEMARGAGKSWTTMRESLLRTSQRIHQTLGRDADFRLLAGQIVEEKQLFFSQEEKNVFHQFSVPLGFRQEKEKGAIELVKVASNRKEQDSETIARLFRITDIGISYKRAEGSLLVWTTSLNTGQPANNVSLFAITKSREIVPLGSTDKNGLLLAKNDLLRKHAPLSGEATARVTQKRLLVDDLETVIAVTENDQSYMPIDETGNIKPDNISAQGRHGKAPDLFKGTVFTERGIYRPGETVYFKGAVRTYHEGTIAPPADLTATFWVVNAKGEEIYRKNMKLSEFGTAGDSLATKTYFPLGTYTLRMSYGGSGDAVTTFEVQEFRQPRHFVEILFKRESRKDDSFINLDIKEEILHCEITGKYYAGGPVKHGRVRWNIYHAKSDYSRPDHPGYGFGYPLEARGELLESGEALLDEQGKIVVSMPIAKEVISGKYGIEVVASVVDFDGRASTESSMYQSDPAFKIGISSHPENVEAGDGQTLYAIVVDKEGKKVTSGSVTVQVMQYGWTYIWKRNEEGHLYTDSQRIWRRQLSSELVIKDGKASFDFDFARGGKYLVAFSYRGKDGTEFISGTAYTVSGGYYYEEEYRDTRRQAERLSMTPEKPLYTAGETIKIFVNPRRPLSSCLLTIEQGDLVEYRLCDLSQGQKTIEIPVKDAFSPNVYISVLGTVARSSFPMYAVQFDTDAPSFLFGTVNVEVKNAQQKLRIFVNDDQKTLKGLPGSEMTLTLIAADQSGKGVRSELAVAVVDESILSMTGFATPSFDGLGKFIVPLGVSTGELRTDVLKQTPYGFLRNAPLTGGDGEEGAGGMSSKIRKDFNPVAYFNPAVLTDESGRAQVTFRFPDSMTTYRIFVVGCDNGSRFGSFSRSALVVKDFYLEPGLPAFLTRGDRFTFFVSAFNKTEKGAPVEFSLKGDEIVSVASAKTSYPVGEYDRVLIPVIGTVEKAGSAEIHFSGKFRNFSDAVEQKIPVNSGHVLGTEIVFGTFRKEAKVSYQLPKVVQEMKWEEIGPEEVKAILTVSGAPFVRMTQGLRYLLHYPYGCIEQTSSGVLPLAALRGIIVKGLIPGITIEETDKFIKPGIERLFSMQTSSGGFGYWPGYHDPHPWGTIYALTAITRAKIAGVDVPQERLDKALNYLSKRIMESAKDEYTYRAFGAYILALNKSLDGATFGRVAENLNDQPREAAMLVYMSAKISGLVDDTAIRTSLKGLLERQWTAGRAPDEFYARYREPAISVLAANLVFPSEEITDRVAARLMGGINREGIWTSTSDTGWSLVALGEYFSGAKVDSNPVGITVRNAGEVTDNIRMNPAGYKTISLDPRAFLKDPTFTIEADTDQTILYKLELSFPRTDYADRGYANGFEIHKSIKNTDGSNSINVGDIVEVTLKFNIKKPGSNYVVLDDPLPAGFVAINSAIKTEEHVGGRTRKASSDEEEDFEGEFGEGLGWEDWYWDPAGFYRFTPNFMEMRNDRVLVFRDRAWNGIYEYSYYARAVAEGEFVLPSTKIQLMYDPEVVAYTPRGKVVIRRK